jgi:hypothetical protein
MTVFGQYFEGKISYANTYKSKNPKMTDQQWTSIMGSRQEYLIKGGDYKSIANGTLVQWQLYINKDNKLYNKMINSETVFWNDASDQGDEILKVEVSNGVTEILGFNSKLSVDTKLFSNHKFGNWFDYLSKSKSLPLKSVVETAEFTLESVATEVNRMQLDSKNFELPSGIKTAKSPY